MAVVIVLDCFSVSLLPPQVYDRRDTPPHDVTRPLGLVQRLNN